MANKILASIFNRFSYFLFETSRLQKGVQFTSQFDNAGARATSKKCCGSQTFGEKRKTVQRGYDAHK
jgi:hypothetical protein